MKTTVWIKAICGSQQALPHFVLLLSELEAIGAHKLRATIAENGFGESERLHLGEESSHATLLRKLLHTKAWSSEIADAEALNQMAHDYFQPLDHGTSDHLSAVLGGVNPHLCYLVVSYLVECRALEVYGDFFHACADLELKETLGKIIRDEEEHLQSMRTQIERVFAGLGHPFPESDFTGLESRLYENLQGRFFEHLGLAA